MRIRTNIILEEELLKKIDVIAGEKHKRAAVIEKALREFIAREEKKAPISLEVETVGKKAGARTK
ncbi:MAG: type II toxin-antitoxin system VapB family antitoxin [Acidobacteria bacterium]|nr:type II toxin-antitoxin system VapB family antitoxin [Acidobacteriota bacterium]MCA1637588.1 type II toxin-antitoxin system VapB family antitoxin [Acidobacteriota bacterium]